MTIAIAVCLYDGALLISDGLRVNPWQNNRVLSTTDKKIKQISSSLATVQVGVTEGTTRALYAINRSVLDVSASTDIFVTEIDRATKYGWDFLNMNLGSDVDRNNPSLKVGLIFGGYVPAVSQGGIIGGTIYGLDGHDDPCVITQDYNFIVKGGEEQGSTSLFKDLTQIEMDNVDSLGIGVRNNVVNAYLSVAPIVIAKVAEENPQIGGTISYMIIRRGFPVTEGTL
jgi:hypothetical protein